MPVAAPEQFFQEIRSFAEIRKEIFGKYLEVWCNLQQERQKTEPRLPLLLLDLEAAADLTTADGGDLLDPYIYRTLLKREQSKQPVQAYTYCKSKPVLAQLSETIAALPFYPELELPPLPLTTAEAKESLTTNLEACNPALIFSDPFVGTYAQQVLEQTIATWGADLLMLVRPETIGRAVIATKPSVAVVNLFGNRLQNISSYCRKEKNKDRRAAYIFEHFRDALAEQNYFNQTFTINQPDREEVDFYLLFASRDSQTYRSFKEMLLPYSVLQDDGVPLFVANTFVQQQTELFREQPKYTITNLEQQLLEQEARYKYKSIEQIYNLDHVNTPYTRQNYLQAIEQLCKAKKVTLLNGSTMQPIKRPVPAAKVKFSN